MYTLQIYIFLDQLLSGAYTTLQQSCQGKSHFYLRHIVCKSLSILLTIEEDFFSNLENFSLKLQKC
jgi:hypothetical protein